MTVASSLDIEIRHLRAACVLAVALAIAACKGDVAGRASPSGAAPTEVSAGEVVIAKPSRGYTVSAAPATGSVSGSVLVKGNIPPLPPATTGAASALCGPSMPDESVQIQGSGLVGAVVWLEGVRSGKPIGLERRLELESDKCRLVPRVQAAVVGSSVNIIGHDNFRQHLQFVAGGESKPRAAVLLEAGEQVIPTDLPFTSPGMVIVRDADHSWVHASLAVFDHPYYAISGAGGKFTIDGVPPGKYTLHAWHERTGAVELPVEVGTGPVISIVTLERKK